MKTKLSGSALAIVICAVAAICTTTGITLAYLFARTPQVNNSFEPVFVSCEVEESFDGTTKSDVKVKNTGDISAYIRATLVVMWTANDGSVNSSAPAEGVDYTISLGSSNWVKGSDGFYYYIHSVAANDATAVLINSITTTADAPDGYSLSVHIAATAIQASPARAVEEAWGVTVHSNGNITPP